jgi:ATP-dependent helicase HrpB
MPALPIDSIIPELKKSLKKVLNAVLTAQPGAGKTTHVPLALLNESWLNDQRIIMLEPRRLAARAAAHRMAVTLGQKVGETVGYRIRMDKRIGPHTRIEVVTEGILTRILQHDPSVTGYGLVIFDEFHERSLHADLGLALCMESQKVLREELRILVMSATLDTGKIASLLGNAPIIRCEGQLFPIETHYLSKTNTNLTEQTVVQTVKNVFIHHTGNILVFLPGMAEIRRVERGLQSLDLGPTVHVAPLYGDLSQDDQDRAIQPPPLGQRKIVLATNIAETSLTIEGIRVVIDTGFVRVARFDPRRGMSRLETIKVSQDSADQRQGRAGRIEPGVCYRLWTGSAHQALLHRSTPEMLEGDLSSLALELALWGTTNPNELSWLDAPPTGAYFHARELLMRLGALDEHGHITSHGKQMVELPLHPRLAHMVLKAKPLRLELLACELAALLSERDFLKAQPGERNMDLRVRVDILHNPKNITKGVKVDPTALQQIHKATEQLKRQLNLTSGETGHPKEDPDKVGLLLAFAYPDRIAQCQNRAEHRYRLANGRGAYFSEPQALSSEENLVIAHLDGGQQWARIFLAAPVRLDDLEEHCPDLIREVQFVTWDNRAMEVTASHQRRLGELILQDQPLRHPDPDQVTTALIQGLRQQGIDCLPWTKELRNWQARVLFMRRIEGENSDWPDVGDQPLLENIGHWLAPYLTGLSRLSQVRRIDLKKPLHALLAWKQQKELDQQAPTHLTVPTGSKIQLQYHATESPILAVRLQEMFGQSETPKIARGKVPVTIHLLSPARRPVQVTQDLASFWANSYQEVKKELKGRYPKHPWPDDPLQAVPTKRTKYPK